MNSLASESARKPREGLAAAALALALAAPVLILLGAIGTRRGWVGVHLGFDWMTVRIAPVLAILGFAFGLLALAAAMTEPRRRMIVPMAAILIGGVTATACGAWRWTAVRALPVHDTATDWRDPLLFSPTLMLARGVDANPVESAPQVPLRRSGGALAGRSVAEANARTCPAAAPIRLNLAPAAAYVRLRTAVRAAGLTLVDDDPKPDTHDRRRLEATSTGVWFGFKDDLAARLQPAGGGTRIDLRVTSRLGLSDFGRGCRLIARLRRDMQP